MRKKKKTNMITILMVYFRWVLLLLSHGGAAGVLFLLSFRVDNKWEVETSNKGEKKSMQHYKLHINKYSNK